MNAFVPFDNPQENVPPFRALQWRTRYVSAGNSFAAILLSLLLVLAGLGILIVINQSEAPTTASEQLLPDTEPASESLGQQNKPAARTLQPPPPH